MVRFLVNLVMIPGVLLAQFAAVSHAHDLGTQGTAHEGQPHFHFHLSLGSPSGSAESRVCSKSGCSAPGAEAAPLSDHDADAVYLEANPAHPEREKLFAAEFLAPPSPGFYLPAGDLRSAHDPRPHQDLTHVQVRCPRYVRFLSLTI